MSELPSGAVTFLFTDVEGSTRLLKQLRDRYGEVLAAHGRLLREAFARHGGRVVDTQGDSFFVAFGSARNAVLAAVEGQRSLAGHRWPEGVEVRVRIGIHTGQAAASEEGYLGLAVHRAARISAAGHGGQVLVSQTTHNLLEDEEDELPGVDLSDLGEQRLKDLDRSVRLFQVNASGLQRDFPPLRTEAPPPAAAPGYRRRRTVLVGALAGVVAVAVAIPIFALGRGEGSQANLSEAVDSGVGVLDARSGAVRGAIELPAAPTAITAGLGYVWAVSAESNAVIVVDPATNTVRDTIRVENAPSGVAIGGGWVWVTNSLSGTVSQIDPETLDVVQPIRVGNGPTGIAAAQGHMWVANTSDHTVSKLRATDGKVIGTYRVGADPAAVASGEGAVWVASKSTAALVKLSPSTGAIVDRIPVGEGPAGVAVGAGSVWVANSLAGTVSRIEPATGDVRGTVDIGSSVDAVAVTQGDIWVASASARTVSRIDGRSSGVSTIDVGNPPTALATDAGAVYVALRPTRSAHAGGTFRVAAAPGSVVDCCQSTPDPARGYEHWGTLPLTNDGLLGWKRAGGQAGTELVPDLAVALPSVSDDRRTYTFQLRRGIRYSDGRLVKASDVRYSFERLYKVLPRFLDEDPLGVEAVSYYGSIVGAGRCRKRPRRCSLARGIVADDRAATVTFHLSAPDPEFLFKLAIPFASVLPKGTSPREPAERPLAATGPYRVASAARGSLRLVRNPRFREWSSAAQPAGFPDEIVFSAVPKPAQRVRLVVQGKADLASSIPGQPLHVPLTHRAQVHVRPQAQTFFVDFAETRPPFDDVRVRRAVNYALDRARVVDLVGGTDVARPTCQVLPPNFPGYKPYCPYTADPSSAGGWTRPDPAKARGLIRASGTAGTEVAVWWHREFDAKVGRYLEQLLDSLGYRARLRLLPGSLDDYFAALEAPDASWQIATFAWLPDYPTASQFIQLLLSCSNPYEDFCDRAIDAKISRALKLQERDPAAANESWAALDRELTDKAPWVPLYNYYGADFVSKRVGNYQRHPLYGALLGQLWVR